MKSTIFISALVLLCMGCPPSIPINGPTNGLVALYRFNGDFQDESNNSNHLNNFGSSLVANRFGDNQKAVYFDGDDFCKSVTSIGIAGNSSRSISLWFNSDGNPNGEVRRLLGWGTDQPQNIASIDIAKYSWISEFRDDEIGYLVAYYYYTPPAQGPLVMTGYTYYSITDYVNSTWAHLVYTWDGAFTKIYLDGVLLENREILSGDLETANNELKLGHDDIYIPDAGNDYYRGYLDDIRIYNRALDSNEVQTLYNLVE